MDCLYGAGVDMSTRAGNGQRETHHPEFWRCYFARPQRPALARRTPMRYRLIVALFAFGVVAGIPTEARAQACSSNVPHSTGQWVTLPYQMPINPISATLLQTGQVLIVAGSENDASNNSRGSESYRAAVWDPTGTTQSS